MGAAWSGGALLEQSVLRAAAARSQAGGAASDLFTFEKMADGVWAALAKPTTWTNCNGVVFELSDGLLVMDSHSKPSAAAALVAQIRRDISMKPVRYLVNSHFHWDHAQGNAHYRESEAGVRIIASEATRRLLAEGAAERMKLAVENAEKALDRAKQAGEEKAVADTQAYLKELRAFRLELPDITVRGDLTLHDKLQELRIVFRGRGHTEGDVSVWSPAGRALATGDLAHGSVPFMGDGFPQDWPTTLNTLAKLEFERFCGGHAGVQTGRMRMDQMGRYIEELTHSVREGMRLGRTVEQLQKEITPATLKSMGGGYLEALTAGGSAAGVASGVSGNVAQVFRTIGRV
jgi:glyoxylase-like metal-dependent hydrolase (beta-lactamase superfamily II)